MKLFKRTSNTLPEKTNFPLLANSNLSYLDNGATTHKPQVVLDAMDDYYKQSNSNVHRGVYKLADQSTQAFEDARESVAKYLSVKRSEIIFTSGTTHSLNLCAHILSSTLKQGDEILTTIAEHHALFVPFQQLAKLTKAKFVVVPLNKDETITEEHINKHITSKTKIIAVSATSNVLGYSLDVSKIKKGKAILVVDSAQSIRHVSNYKNADAVAFSAHKIYGPMGMGVLWMKKDLLSQGEPLFTGGAMIQKVTVENTTWALPPTRYEAGTPNVAGAVGLATALDYYEKISKSAEKREQELTVSAQKIISKYARIIGPVKKTAPIISFVFDGVHGHDVAQVLDSIGVCVRAGHHCCQPLHDALKIDASVRVSIAFYNTEADLKKLEEGLKKVKEVFG